MLEGTEWGADRLLRYHQLARVIRDAAGPVAVLEVGAGPGNLRAWNWPAPVVAVDVQAHRGLSVRADATRLPFPDGTFEATACVDVIEHIPPDLRDAVAAELHRVTRGALVIGGPFGSGARRTDQRLHRRLRQLRREPPDWLEEHLSLGEYPTHAQLEAALHHRPETIDRGVARWAHASLVLLQAVRGGWRATTVMTKAFPRFVGAMTRIGRPYRSLLVFRSGHAPTFSVVLATRNRADRVGTAIDSVLAQDERDFELVVVDDASTDGTAALLRDYARRDERMRVVTAPRPSGSCGRARNHGVLAASGRYLAFLDDDNSWRPNHLSECRAALREAGACVTRVQRYLPDGRALDVIGPAPGEPIHGAVDANALAVRAEHMVPFPDGQGRYNSEDARLVRRLRQRGVSFAAVPEVTVDYRFNHDSMCFTYDIVDTADGVEVRGKPIVRSWRAVYGRVAEIVRNRAERVTRRGEADF